MTNDLIDETVDEPWTEAVEWADRKTRIRANAKLFTQFLGEPVDYSIKTIPGERIVFEWTHGDLLFVAFLLLLIFIFVYCEVRG